MTNDELLELARQYPPPPEWYEGEWDEDPDDFNGPLEEPTQKERQMPLRPDEIDKFVADAMRLFFPTLAFNIRPDSDPRGHNRPGDQIRIVECSKGALFGYDCHEFTNLSWPQILTTICDRLKACEFDQQQIERQLLMVARCRFPSGTPVPPGSDAPAASSG